VTRGEGLLSPLLHREATFVSEPKLQTVDWNNPELVDAKQYEMEALVAAIARCEANIETYRMVIEQQTEEKSRLQAIVEKKEMLRQMGIETG